ncbi:hypothetical protein [Mycobacterium sp. 1274761.0]|uniref:hypothetical protein n=1 Tax=Mycobacterium sp. 1274761.0 TaxID=1834077 RepID=UPI0007FC0E83|nr:hypothetical protein [Mycobacterium sp. 1274761.0]OBK74363.1 hypothetical protein A5651_10920 [Mycobacterium sp. 1274761.0]
MSGKHRTKSRSNLVIGSIAASVGASSVLAAAIVELAAPQEPSHSAVQPQQPVTQQGRLIAVTADSLTAQSADGAIQTYSITPNTTAITDRGGSASPATSFTVDDEVTVVGTRQGGMVVATAVADQSAVGGQGRPMDYGV